MTDLSAEQLRELVRYDQASGVFTWAKSCGTRKAGDIAGSKSDRGYVRLKIGRREYKAHRLAWLHVHGRWPAGEIDHINGVRDDNRICNLREASRAENAQNVRRARSDNRASVLIGASWDGHLGRWRARIGLGGNRRSLGLFSTEEEAHAAYVAAKAELHPFSSIVQQGREAAAR